MDAPATPIHPDRVRALNDAPGHGAPVLYWMSRDARVADNWALLHARAIAAAADAPLAVVFTLAPSFLAAPWRAYHFLLAGLRGVERDLRALGIPFAVLYGADPPDAVTAFVRAHGVGHVVVDFNPLRLAREWRSGVGDRLAAAGVRLEEVDAHNIVPCWAASGKLEFAARTIRPKIARLLDIFLEPFPSLAPQTTAWPTPLPVVDWTAAEGSLSVDRSVGAVDWIAPGASEARRALDAFLADSLGDYTKRRNDPNADGQSGLSPYLHFGQLAPARVALEVRARLAAGGPDIDRAHRVVPDAATFLEELVVRRELSDNFCLYQPAYDAVAGFPAWARRTLDAHRGDAREALYDVDAFGRAATHDALWNACQCQMVRTGKMHGYLRMYWAKMILAWSATPEEALATAIVLNDRYELDGRDPNGYAGIAWAIGGVHDRPWFDRPVFGTVRFMSASGAARKFDVGAYVRRWPERDGRA
ncbi:MAG: deoxyribodipyrimidine photo-lyase [Ardenticatenales bacterium]|jgi:deoxyribodipyrimidine photo-lyase|nr:deoxyribodipyrimidine photo-lyase [Ardenticatenales bacterium]